MRIFGVKELSQRLSKIVKDYLYPYGTTSLIIHGVIKHDKNSKVLSLKTSTRFGSYLSFTLVDKDEADSNDPKHTINVWQGGAKMIEGLQYGVEVEIVGTLTISAKSSNYYLSAKQITVTDENAIKHILLKRKEEFQKKGYFAKSANRYKLSQNPRRIGIVTSKDGSVIHDMTNTLNLRYPICEILFYSCGVQGDDTVAETIAAGIRKLDKMNLDAIIVARGGGSAQDLMVFSNEIVVKAMHEANTYIVSAIGHQDDEPLCDLSANWRSATPTAAIDDIVAYSKDTLLHWLSGVRAYDVFVHNMINHKRLDSNININMTNYFSYLMSNIVHVEAGIVQQKIYTIETQLFHLCNVIDNLQTNKINNNLKLLENYTKRHIYECFTENFNRTNKELEFTYSVISSYSYENVLNRGFCLVISNDSKIITSKYEFETIDKHQYKIKFKDGDCQL